MRRSCAVWLSGAGTARRSVACLCLRRFTTVIVVRMRRVLRKWACRIIRDWVLRFNAEGPEGLKDRKASGSPRKLSAEHRAALAAVVESGPDPAIHGVVRWRRSDLAAWLKEQFGISLAETTPAFAGVGWRELRRMGYAKLSARPRHYAQDKAALAAFKESSRNG